MATAITKEQREQAKREGKTLIQISIDAKHLPLETVKERQVFAGRFELTGPMTLERAEELMALCDKWMTENKAARGKK